jgi:N-methylhydantoinase A
MCYPGQNFDMSVPILEGRALTDEDLLDLAGRFHDLHESSRGFAFRGQQPLLRGLRCAAGGRTPKPARLAALGDVGDPQQALRQTRPVFFNGAFVETPIYDGSRLAAGATVAGPGLIEEPFTVVVVPPGQRARLDEHGNYDIAAV